MNQDDVDKLLKRRLYLQRYITSLGNELTDGYKAGDKELILLLSEFVADASEKDLLALSRLRTSHKPAREMLASIRDIIKEQRLEAMGLLKAQISELVEQEAKIVTAALGKDKVPSMAGVASWAVGGATISETMATSHDKYYTRLIGDITQAASTDPNTIVRLVRGSAQERMRDGIFRWRDDRLIRPAVDVIVNGSASNAANHVYDRFKVTEVDFVATLDYRVCASCFSAESGSPYKLGNAPRVPQHPRCRCLHIARIGDDSNERPYVADKRSVKDIPKDERDGKIGRTRDTIAEFFDRMSNADLKDYLGPSRYALWNSGKIDSVKDLVNAANLRPLRLDQLPPI